MKMLTQELTGMPLRWALAQCCDQAVYWHPQDKALYMGEGSGDVEYAPDTNWDLGGPLFEAHIQAHDQRGENYFYCWTSKSFALGQMKGTWATGPTLLVAAGRCIVASKMGPSIEVPDYLVPEQALTGRESLHTEDEVSPR